MTASRRPSPQGPGWVLKLSRDGLGEEQLPVAESASA